jgi:hypothetical protein
MRDLEVIDSELRLLLAIRKMAREAEGRIPNTARIAVNDVLVSCTANGFNSELGLLVAQRRTYKRDRRGRFASAGSSRIKRAGRKINRRRPRYVRGSLGKTLRVGRVGHLRMPSRAPGPATTKSISSKSKAVLTR